MPIEIVVKEAKETEHDKRRTPYYERYRTGVILDSEFLTWDFKPIPSYPTDTYYTVEPGKPNRLDQIATEVYGHPRYYWIIAIANDIDEPWLPIPYGTTLRIPDLNKLILDKYFD